MYVCDVQQKVQQQQQLQAAAGVLVRSRLCGGGEKPGVGNDFAKRVANEILQKYCFQSLRQN